MLVLGIVVVIAGDSILDLVDVVQGKTLLRLELTDPGFSCGDVGLVLGLVFVDDFSSPS